MGGKAAAKSGKAAAKRTHQLGRHVRRRLGIRVQAHAISLNALKKVCRQAGIRKVSKAALVAIQKMVDEDLLPALAEKCLLMTQSRMKMTVTGPDTLEGIKSLLAPPIRGFYAPE